MLLALGRHSSAGQAVDELEHLVASRLAATNLGALLVPIGAVVAMAQLQVRGDVPRAAASAHRALLALRAVRTPSQFALFFAYAHVAHVLLEALAWEPGAGAQALAAEALEALELFAMRFRAAGPRLLLSRGSFAWLLGRRSEAARSWADGLRLAERLAMPYESARIRWEVGARTQDAAALAAGSAELAGMGVRVSPFGRCLRSAQLARRRRPAARGAAEGGGAEYSGAEDVSERGARVRTMSGAWSAHSGTSGSAGAADDGAGGVEPSSANPSEVGDLSVRGPQHYARKGSSGKPSFWRGRRPNEPELHERARAAGERFDFTTGTSGLDWAKGEGGPAERTSKELGGAPDAEPATPASADAGASGWRPSWFGGAHPRSDDERYSSDDSGRGVRKARGGLTVSVSPKHERRQPPAISVEGTEQARQEQRRKLFNSRAEQAQPSWAEASNLRAELQAANLQGSADGAGGFGARAGADRAHGEPGGRDGRRASGEREHPTAPRAAARSPAVQAAGGVAALLLPQSSPSVVVHSPQETRRELEDARSLQAEQSSRAEQAALATEPGLPLPGCESGGDESELRRSMQSLQSLNPIVEDHDGEAALSSLRSSRAALSHAGRSLGGSSSSSFNTSGNQEAAAAVALARQQALAQRMHTASEEGPEEKPPEG